MKRVVVIAFLVFLALWGYFYLVAESRRSGAPIRLVIPDGFRGVFKIVADPVNGADVQLSGGRFTFVIPKNGLLKVRSLEMFGEWHTESVMFDSGIATTLDNTESPDTVSVHDLGGDLKEKSYLVGTEAQMKVAHSSYEQLDLGGVISDEPVTSDSKNGL